MKVNPPISQSAYMFTLMIMLTMFLLITAVLGVTASSRRVSGHYIQFAGLYDMALASNERALFLLRDAIDHQSISNQVHNRLRDEGIKPHLVYRSGDFFIDDRFMVLFREEKNNALAAFLADHFARTQARYYHYTYSLSIGTNTYEVRTYIEPRLGVYRVHSTVSKLIDGRPGQITRVDGTIEWPAFIPEIMVIIVEGDDGEIEDFEIDAGAMAGFEPELVRVQRRDMSR
ncbi:MAG: hypothetical protein FWD03_07950 [Defluviitaleaceae bacterium]|nr:hypothetical protein [Defluviitaleaceae bacterium]